MNWRRESAWIAWAILVVVLGVFAFIGGACVLGAM
jgi:hypothetical protein